MTIYWVSFDTDAYRRLLFFPRDVSSLPSPRYRRGGVERGREKRGGWGEKREEKKNRERKRVNCGQVAHMRQAHVCTHVHTCRGTHAHHARRRLTHAYIKKTEREEERERETERQRERQKKKKKKKRVGEGGGGARENEKERQYDVSREVRAHAQGTHNSTQILNPEPLDLNPKP